MVKRCYANYCPNCDGPSILISFDPEEKAIFKCGVCGTQWDRPGDSIYVRDTKTGEVGLDPLSTIAKVIP